MIVSKRLLTLWVVCLSLILIALVVRFSQTKTIGNQTATLEDASLQPDVSLDQSFYDDLEFDDKQTTNKDEPVPSVTVVAKPSISARAYLVGNVQTGKIYIEKNSKIVLPVASMSKLITAIEAIDRLASTTMITIPEEASSTPDTARLVPGEKFILGDILYPLLLNSSNIAAEALASSIDRTKFMDVMSSYSWEIGMPSTYFADPSGISPSNTSSATDFFALARYLYKSRPDILSITKTAKISVATTTDHGYHDFINIHPFVKDPNFLGGKTGHTLQAKDTMLTILNIEKQPIAIIVLSSDNRRLDTIYLTREVRKMITSSF